MLAQMQLLRCQSDMSRYQQNSSYIQSALQVCKAGTSCGYHNEQTIGNIIDKYILLEDTLFMLALY